MRRLLARARCALRGHDWRPWSLPWHDLGNHRFEHTRPCATCGFKEIEIDG